MKVVPVAGRSSRALLKQLKGTRYGVRSMSTELRPLELGLESPATS